MNDLTDILKSHKIIAHRGCWDSAYPENSMPAFELAVKKGYAIELDVHLLADGQVAIFHDFSLRRMCRKSGRIERLSSADLNDCKLKNTNYSIPLFSDLLKKTESVPLYVELKCADNEIELCNALIAETENYNGELVFIGFSEKAIGYFKQRGYTVCLSRFVPKNADFSPDGMLCEVHCLPLSAKRRAKFPTLVPWTVSSAILRRHVEKICIASIYNTKKFKDLK